MTESTLREPASLPFPRFTLTSEPSDILEDYPAYLAFVLEAGKASNPGAAHKLAETYDKLRRRSPAGAARFLKGLRFEMVHKLQLMGRPPSSVTTANPEIRHWVGRFLNEWLREADEHLFRSIVLRAQ